MKNTDFEIIQKIAESIYQRYEGQDTYIKYVGITEADIYKFITADKRMYRLVKMNVFDCLEEGYSIDFIVDKLYTVYDQYCRATASIM